MRTGLPRILQFVRASRSKKEFCRLYEVRKVSAEECILMVFIAVKYSLKNLL